MLWECAIVALASVAQSFGLALQRLSHLNTSVSGVGSSSEGDQNREGDDSIARSVSLWRTGIVLFVVANIFGSTVQLTVLPLVLVCTLQAIGIAANSLFAVIILGDRLTIRSAVGTLLVLSGAVMVAGLGRPRPEPELGFSDLLSLYLKPSFVKYILVTVAVGSILVYFARRTRSSGLRGCFWGASGGIASALSLLMAKLTVGQLLRQLPHSLTLLSRVSFYASFVLFLFFALFQMLAVNCGLQFVSTAVLYPLVFCIYNLLTVSNSIALLGVEAVFDSIGLVWAALGTLQLLMGVLVLSMRFECQKSAPEPAQQELVSNDTYTSFDAITRPQRHSRARLSREQASILQELGFN